MFTKLQMNVFCVFCVILTLGYLCEAGITRTEGPLKCHICDPDTCATFDRKAKPQECNADMLEKDNEGPSKLSELSYIPFSKLDQGVPIFSCQKLEAYDHKGNLNVMRRCQVRLEANASCNQFYNKFQKDIERTFTNASCYLCDIDGCNAANFLYIFFPLIVMCGLLSFLLK